MVVLDMERDSTEASQETRMDQLKEEIEQGVYEVDARAVADAMLRRLTPSTAAAGVPRY